MDMGCLLLRDALHCHVLFGALISAALLCCAMCTGPRQTPEGDNLVGRSRSTTQMSTNGSRFAGSRVCGRSCAILSLLTFYTYVLTFLYKRVIQEPSGTALDGQHQQRSLRGCHTRPGSISLQHLLVPSWWWLNIHTSIIAWRGRFDCTCKHAHLLKDKDHGLAVIAGPDRLKESVRQ